MRRAAPRARRPNPGSAAAARAPRPRRPPSSRNRGSAPRGPCRSARRRRPLCRPAAHGSSRASIDNIGHPAPAPAVSLYTAAVSPVRVLAVVGFAAILVVAALFLTRPSKPPADAASLMPFSPATAAQIIIERPDGRVEAARRGESGDWEIDLNGPQSSEHRWPANPSNVRAALQLLSQFRPSQLADDHAAIGKDATRL